MLAEIRCERFRLKKISFHEGLNVILGDEEATNSIGKSTLLMVIDFVFGGEFLLTYNTDMVRELGDHEYLITFSFESERLYFRRATASRETIASCDSDFNVLKTLTVQEYVALLKQAYNIPDELTFRSAIGLYFRIWGKPSCNVNKPLHAAPEQPSKDAVLALLKLFGSYKQISQLETQRRAADTRSLALRQAFDADVLPKIGVRGHRLNAERIAELDDEIEDIKSGFARYTANVSEIVNSDLLQLKTKKDELLSTRLVLQSRLARVSRNLSNNRHIKAKHFEGLLEFFPEIDVDRLARIEEFHSGVAQLLKLELEEAQRTIQQQLDSTNDAIADIDAKMKRSLPGPDEAASLVERLITITAEAQKARRENEYFEADAAAKSAATFARESLTTTKRNVMEDVETRINDQMARIVLEIFGDKRKSPVLRLEESSYTLKVFEDTGTGTAYTSLIVFDLAVFELTRLPAIAHDSLLYKNIENDSVARLFARYESSSKQSFVAIDEIQKYGDATARFLGQRAVVRLSKGDVLYDKDWRPVSSEPGEDAVAQGLAAEDGEA